jgi:penicillin amidase
LRLGTGLRQWLLAIVVLTIMAAAVTIGLTGCASWNRYQDEGVLTLSGLRRPARVLRDEKGMAYIYADELKDAFLAMGFVTAQDRLFQMELTRLVAAGRIGELVGAQALPLDRRLRTVGIYRQAARHAAIMDAASRWPFEQYIKGINAYIHAHGDSHHLEFKLAGLQPAPWTLTDALSILYYMSWSTSANIKTEIIAQTLVEKLGPVRARTLFPLNINPDENLDMTSGPGAAPAATMLSADLDPLTDRHLRAYLDDGRLGVGSNNWATGPRYAAAGKPVMANDPHLDGRILPGPWYPCGLMTPALRIVGVHIPGLPAMPIFRNRYLAAGITNAYGDVQDLYIETLDPADAGRYLEGSQSYPFAVIEETLRYRDKEAPGGMAEEKLTIRKTRRGPVISGVFPGLAGDRVVSLRWAAVETIQPATRFIEAMTARSVKAFQESIRHWSAIVLNFVCADIEGNIGWVVSGKLPVRANGDGTLPRVITGGEDNWTGWIPFAQMPRAVNPEKGWVGTCNHKTVGADYPYYYSSYFSPGYRYRRLTALLQTPAPLGVEDHYRFQRDTLNRMAVRLTPVFADALKNHEDTRELGTILAQWNFRDDPDLVGPTVFHAVYDRLALRVFEDDLGPEAAATMLGVWYFWQERFQRMIDKGQSSWFDDIRTTDRKERLADMIHLAGVDARASLAKRFGTDPRQWRWGRAHTIEYVSPIRRQGFGKGFLGAGRHPAAGSVETLHRGIYRFDAPFDVNISATLRMVADLGDPDKVLAVLGGGVSGRVFHDHAHDQVQAFLDGEKRYWWFSDAQIQAHAQGELTLEP